MIHKNEVHLMDCLKGLELVKDNSIDFIVTSPPYDQLRTYESSTSILEVGKECFRTLKDGGIMAMVIQDQTKDFAKSLTSFRTCVSMCDEIGFRLFETVIWQRHGRPGAWWNKRFRVDHEYVFLFLKGNKPKHFDKEPLKIQAIHVGKKLVGTTRKNDGSIKRNTSGMEQPNFKCRGTIWSIDSSKSEHNKVKLKHPATFPNQLAKDLLTCFTKEDELVLDPFAGSGTTCVVAKELKRNYIGFEIDETYHAIAQELLKGGK
jgi:site-specific DNA-methyltransferase (adenine-specific)